jgi:hypothetical protein
LSLLDAFRCMFSGHPRRVGASRERGRGCARLEKQWNFWLKFSICFAPFPWRPEREKTFGNASRQITAASFLFYYIFLNRNKKNPFQLALLLGLEKSWRESSIPREKSLESIQFRYPNARKREKTKICPHLFFSCFFRFFFFIIYFQFVASSHVPPIHTTGVDLPPLHFLLARFRINRIELHTLDVREREGGERRFTHTSCNVFFFPFLFWFAARSR